MRDRERVREREMVRDRKGEGVGKEEGGRERWSMARARVRELKGSSQESGRSRRRNQCTVGRAKQHKLFLIFSLVIHILLLLFMSLDYSYCLLVIRKRR